MKRKIKKRLVFLVICILLFFPLSIFLILSNIDFDNYETVMAYTEKSNTDYNVDLKENSYFKEKSLPKDQSYITSIIDSVNVFFDYEFESSKKFDYNYSYWIVGTLSTNIRGNDEKQLWRQDYPLVDEKKVTKDDSNSFKISEELKINYGEYNSLVNNFKQDYVLALDAKLDVKLFVKIDGTVETESINTESVAQITIPLSEQTIEIMMDYTEINNDEIIKNNVPKVIKNYFVFGLGILIIIFVVGYVIIFAHLTAKKTSKFDKELKKILVKYNSIVINTIKEIDLRGLKKFEVESFQELVDAQNELRIPISYFTKKKNFEKEAWFVLIHEKNVWYYVLKSYQDDGLSK